MKPILTKKHQLVITAILIGLILLSSLIFPGRIAARQTTPEPTPTSTPIQEDLEENFGDTEDLIWGAGAILIIILSGVLVQRYILRPDPIKSED